MVISIIFSLPKNESRVIFYMYVDSELVYKSEVYDVSSTNNIIGIEVKTILGLDSKTFSIEAYDADMSSFISPCHKNNEN